MRTIWKYVLAGPRTNHQIPKGYYIRAVGLDAAGSPAVWCEVNPDAEKVAATFDVTGTGHPVPSTANPLPDYLGMFVLPNEGFVGHVWQVYP